ncbi:MAG: hypothetical protein KJ709_03040 [Nanoarchaeota archaeon]|nr:hypothetical protein [Nanoarchaeota archaeon]
MINDQALAEIRGRVLRELLSASERQASVLLLGQGGKTALLREAERTLKKRFFSHYLDLRKVHTPPELFSLQIAGLACAWSLSLEPQSPFDEFLRKHKEKLDPALKEAADLILSELEKVKPDQKRLIQTAFSMLEELAKKHKRFFLALDNADRLLDLDNFPKVGDIFSLLPRNITFLISSSVDALKPRLQGFTTITLEPLTKEETSKLVERLAGKQAQKVVDEIISLSSGNAHVVEVLCSGLKQSKDVKTAFLKELVWRHGRLYQHCDSVYSKAMARARGKSLLHSIMLILSKEDLKLSELARKLYRSAPVTKSLVERLAGLVEKRDKVFIVKDPLLREWLRLSEHWSDSEPEQLEVAR